MSAQLTPVFPSDLITPGVIYFARLDAQRSSDINSWWLVLRCSEDLLPQPFLDSKNLQARTFPFWVIGRLRFAWLDRSSLFILHPSQKSAFQNTDLRDSFESLYSLATGVAKTDPFIVFRRQILEARDHYLCQENHRIVATKDDQRSDPAISDNPESDEMFIPDEYESEPRIFAQAIGRQDSVQRGQSVRCVGHKTRTSVSIKAPSVDLQDRPILSVLSSPIQPRVRIKTEAEEHQIQYANAVSVSERVRIFIGTKEFTTSCKILEKSPILSSYVQRDDIGLFIMHPKLNEAKEEDLLTVLDFMQRGSFDPKVVSLPAQGQSRSAPAPLEGLKNSEDYSKELMRCGRLYLLGKVFQIHNLKAYIVRRISTTEYRPYTIASIITLARIIFRHSGHHQAGFEWGSSTSAEAMEQWIITALAENFREIMQVSADRDLFWVMEKETTSRRLVAEVFARCAENYSKIGGMPVKID